MGLSRLPCRDQGVAALRSFCRESPGPLTTGPWPHPGLPRKQGLWLLLRLLTNAKERLGRVPGLPLVASGAQASGLSPPERPQEFIPKPLPDSLRPESQAWERAQVGPGHEGLGSLLCARPASALFPSKAKHSLSFLCLFSRYFTEHLLCAGLKGGFEGEMKKEGLACQHEQRLRPEQ